MKRRSLVFSTACLVALALAAYFLLANSGRHMESAPVSSVADGLSRPSNVAAAQTAGAGSSEGAPTPLSASSNAADIVFVARYEQWAAKSVDEAHWLQRHGYPDTETAARYSTLSDASLAALAAEGDQLARLLHAERRAHGNGGRPAIDEMFSVAADGSIYALERLALVQRTNESGMMEAYLQAARLRGNYAAPVLLTSAPTAEDLAMRHALAQAILDRLNQLRSQRGLAPFGVDPRPGAGVTFEELFIEGQSRLAPPPQP
jgi:hypothetical protein